MGKHKHDKDYDMYEEENYTKRSKGVRVDIDINVTRIMKYLCIAGVFIVAVIFGTRTIRSIINETFDSTSK